MDPPPPVPVAPWPSLAMGTEVAGVAAVERVPLADLTEDPDNAMLHGDANIGVIMRSLARFGQRKPLVVGPGGVVQAGSGALRAMRQLGWKECEITRSPLVGLEAKAYAIADNRSAQLAHWDDDGLAKALLELATANDELARATGFAPPTALPEIDMSPPDGAEARKGKISVTVTFFERDEPAVMASLEALVACHPGLNVIR